jgi:hypothetical protein
MGWGDDAGAPADVEDLPEWADLDLVSVASQASRRVVSALISPPQSSRDAGAPDAPVRVAGVVTTVRWAPGAGRRVRCGSPASAS